MLPRRSRRRYGDVHRLSSVTSTDTRATAWFTLGPDGYDDERQVGLVQQVVRDAPEGGPKAANAPRAHHELVGVVGVRHPHERVCGRAFDELCLDLTAISLAASS